MLRKSFDSGNTGQRSAYCSTRSSRSPSLQQKWATKHNELDIWPEDLAHDGCRCDDQLTKRARLHGVAVHELLLAEHRKIAAVDGIDTLHAAGRRERPARAALQAGTASVSITIAVTPNSGVGNNQWAGSIHDTIRNKSLAHYL